MLDVLCIIGCPVQLIREVFSRLHLCRHTFDTHLPQFDALTQMVIHVSSAFIFAICLRKAYISICVCQGFVESSKAFNTLSKILL